VSRRNVRERGYVELWKILAGNDGLKSHNDIILVAELEKVSHQHLSAKPGTDCPRRVV
jgi:hypothetical protein